MALPTRVPRTKILGRGLAHRCPNCGSRTIFEPLPHWITVNDRCAECGLVFERGEGFFLGSIVINYMVTGLMLAPVLVLVAMGSLSVTAAMVFMAAWCVLFPLAFFRTSKSLWLMTYYLFVPGDLPANGGEVRDHAG